MKTRNAARANIGEQNRLRLIGCFASLLLLAACGESAAPIGGNADAGRGTSEPGPAQLPAGEAARWDSVLDRWLGKPAVPICDAPGGVLLVDTPAGRYLKAAGVSSVESGRPVQTGDRFEIGSNTKSFTVVLALQLQEAGSLAMDDLLDKWLPEIAARIPGGDRITLRQLAGNTAGVRDYADPLMQPLIEANDREGLAKAYDPIELVDFGLATGAPAFAPGEGWQYSSTNFILLGLVVEAASGKTLSALYQAHIFDALGMASTTYLEGVPDPGSIVDGYYTVPGDERIDMTDWNATQAGAAGAIVSTAEDMARYARGLFRGELFRDRATLAEMLRFTELTEAQGAGFMRGYGFGLVSFRTTGFRAIGHSGQTPGFQSVWFELPEADTRIVFLANSGSCPAQYLPLLLPPEQFGDEPATRPSDVPDPARPNGGAAPSAGETADPLAQLTGRSWRLVEIQSMDDAEGVSRPDDSSLYTMTLGKDGTASFRLHCNRGIASWSAEATSADSGRLEFSRMGMTRAACPPPSLDVRIAGAMGYVRSYLFRDGRLHLSLMADGGIYSWEPAPPDASASSR